MKATVRHGPRDNRFEERPEPKILKPAPLSRVELALQQ